MCSHRSSVRSCTKSYDLQASRHWSRVTRQEPPLVCRSELIARVRHFVSLGFVFVQELSDASIPSVVMGFFQRVSFPTAVVDIDCVNVAANLNGDALCDLPL